MLTIHNFMMSESHSISPCAVGPQGFLKPTSPILLMHLHSLGQDKLCDFFGYNNLSIRLWMILCGGVMHDLVLFWDGLDELGCKLQPLV